MPILFDCVDPGCPPRSCLGIWPPAVGFENPTKPKDPRRDLNIYKRNIGAQKEWPFGVSGSDQLVEAFFQFLCVRDLFLLVLFLENTIEIGHNVSIDLKRVGICQIATIYLPPERDGTYMICPQSTMSTQFCISRWEKRRATL